jgi:HK97 family phage portal protein
VKRGGGIPPSVLKNNQLQLDPEQSAAVRERAVAAFTSGKPFVTGSDWDLTIPGIPPNQAAFIEILQMSANQIAAMYGIDPREVGGSATDSLTYSTDESKNLNRASNMRPYITRIENAINRCVPERQFVKLNMDATIRTDISTRMKVQGWQVADGRLSVNEARAQNDLTPVKGGDRYNFLLPATPGTEKPVTEPTRSAPSTEGETQ